ncbi:MAG: hypothetical protein IPM66_07010 [Acidobacteriota bacterium]|nr:MAG: hypothetical protein IPM66_07010 [Acidobacteriota bacterium]
MVSLIKYPTRKYGLALALALSVLVHAGLVLVMRYGPVLQVALGMRDIEFVEEEYDKAILIDFSKKLSYPPGYIGFRAPSEVKSLEELKKDQERQARREAARKRREEAARREAEEKAKAEQLAEAEKPQPPKNDGYPGGFGKINTAPIKDQIQRLYDAHRGGKLPIPEGKLRVGVAGRINSDGTLSDYRIIVPSGIKEIDEAALAILEAVSVSRALGPLSNLSSLSMILDIDQVAQLNVIGFTSNEQDARAIVDLANTVLLFAKIRKSNDAAAMVMLNNLKVSRTGQRVQATISVPRQKAKDTLAQSMSKGQ